MEPGRKPLEDLIRRCGVKLGQAQYDALWTYHRMLRGRTPP